MPEEVQGDAPGDAPDNGWAASADAWIADLDSPFEFGRRHVLDPVMEAAVAGRGFIRALDVGCGEGRFCRLMAAHGIAATGVDPTAPLIAEARRRDPAGDYRVAGGEALPFADASFDLVVSYVALLDIPDLAAAIAEMARVVVPGGTVLIANVNPFNTAMDIGSDGRTMRRYLEAREDWTAWRGIRVRNHHRPMQTYMTLLIEAGLILRRFVEPAPVGGPPPRQAKYLDVPWFHVMEWQKPSGE